MPKLELLLEAERRGILPEDKKGLLSEARARGLIPQAPQVEQAPQSPQGQQSPQVEIPQGKRGGATRAFGEEPELSWGETAGQAIGNIPSSAINVGKDFVGAGKMLLDAAAGLGRMAGSPIQTFKDLQNVDIGETLNKIRQVGGTVFDEMIAKRYGGINNFKKTLAADPVGVMMDASTLLGGVGGLMTKAGGAGRLSTAGKVISKAAEKNDPVQMAIKAGKGVSKLKTAKKIGLGAKDVDQVIDRGIVKSIRPSVSGQKTYPQIKQYTERARDAVKTIMDNKNNLVFTTDLGEEAGRYPKTLREFSQAVDQTKSQIFREYNQMALGTEGAVGLEPIAKALDKPLQSKALQDFHPEIIDYVQARKDALLTRGAYTPEEAQDAIKILNNSLESFYKNPTYETASKAYVDSLIVNNLRSGLDSVIENLKGPGYQTLKNKYGSLKTIEKDVGRAAVVDARKNIKGLIDFSDVFSGYHLMKGLISLDPAQVTAGVAAKGVAGLYRHLNNPNRVVKSMFSGAEKAEKAAERAAIAASKQKIPLNVRMGVYQAGRAGGAMEKPTDKESSQ